MQVTIEVQVATKRVWNHQDHQPHAVCPPGQTFDDLGPEGRQVMEQVAVVPEQGPEHIRHGEGDVGIGCVGEFPPLVALPERRRPVAATWTGAGLARVGDHPGLIGGGEHLGAQGGGATGQHLAERLPHGGPHLLIVPIGPCQGKDVLEPQLGRLPESPLLWLLLLRAS